MEIRSKHSYLPKPWPKADEIEILVRKSSGQFIYAATVVRYIARGQHGQEKRLRIVLELRSSENLNTPFAMLDALYLQIFRSVGEDEIEKVMEVISALICLKDNIRRLDFLETFFDYRAGELASVMGDVLALIHVWDSGSEVVRIYHASLPDFLFDPTRARSFYLDLAQVYLNVGQRCKTHLLSRKQDPSTIIKQYRLGRCGPVLRMA